MIGVLLPQYQVAMKIRLVESPMAAVLVPSMEEKGLERIK